MDNASRAALALLVTAALVSACGGQTREESDLSQPAASRGARSTTSPICPHPPGGSCLGTLAAGTYTTRVFEPAITYTVPDGWSNYEDLVGNFLLVPPGGSVEGVDAGTSDYIGIYSSTAAIDRCNERPAPGVGHSPGEIAAQLTSSVEGLAVTGPTAVEVGGLRGVVLDLELQEGFEDGCDPAAPFTVVPVIIARPPSSFSHAVVTGLTMRLYLLSRDTETLAIEVNDLHGGSRLDEYSRLVNQWLFATPK